MNKTQRIWRPWRRHFWNKCRHLSTGGRSDGCEERLFFPKQDHASECDRLRCIILSSRTSLGCPYFNEGFRKFLTGGGGGRATIWNECFWLKKTPQKNHMQSCFLWKKCWRAKGASRVPTVEYYKDVWCWTLSYGTFSLKKGEMLIARTLEASPCLDSPLFF